MKHHWSWIGAGIALLSIYILFVQLIDPYWAGFAIEEERHLQMLRGEAHFYNPWQYRIFSSLLLEGIIRLFDTLSIHPTYQNGYLDQYGLDLSRHLAHLFLRFLQNIFILLFAYKYYKLLGVNSPILIFLGLILLSQAMGPANFSADLSFNSYFDLLFYLIAAYSILRSKWIILPFLMCMAALNRETSAFIPLMALVALFSNSYEEGAKLITYKGWSIAKKETLIIICSAGLFFLILIALRWYYGFPEAKTVYGNKYPWEFARWNLTQLTTYTQWLRTFHLIPFLAIFVWKRWPPILKQWGLMMIPLWLLVHLGHGIIRETRLFLVPIAIICIPGILLAVEQELRAVQKSGD